MTADNPAYRRVVNVQDGYLNRYWDDATIPCQKSYAFLLRLMQQVGMTG